jgi:hypothetical protein
VRWTEIALILTNTGTLIAALVGWRRARAQSDLDGAAHRQIELDITRRHNNRRVQLEAWADEIHLYHRALRDWLLDLVARDVIDMKRVNLSEFPQPPKLPPWNGNGNK